ncbi:MAG: hypothetical protein MPK10_00510 [Gammaproteobacteria bacterium]|nr:hypothetical protein [Gammaproteobacteria bacterium]
MKTSTINMGHPIVTADKREEDALQKVTLADFWVFVLLEGKSDPCVRASTVCDSRDTDMLELRKTHWWYNPWTAKAGSAARAKWENQTDESGWQLIIDHLAVHPA